MKKILLFFLTLSIYSAQAQNKSPMQAMRPSALNATNARIGCSLFTDPNNYTSASTFTYNAPVNNNSNLVGPSNASYGCMGSVPNQAWFIITVNTSGNLYFNFFNSNNYDVDAVVWGPLANNDVANACTATENYPLTCDYDVARPDLYINNAQAGQKYVMLVTNYSNANTVITVSQPTVNGSSNNNAVTYSMVNLPNCSLTPSASITGTSTTINEGQSSTLTLSFTGSSPWNYTLSDGTVGTTYITPINITVYPTASQTYTINSVNNLCGTSGGSGSVGISVVRNVQLKSCFPLDGNAIDSQGLNNGGLQNGVATTTNRASEANKALQFDGIDDYVNLTTSQFNNSTFAFASWVKLEVLPDANNTENIALSVGGFSDEHYLSAEYTNGNALWKFSSNGISVYSSILANTDWHLLVGVRTGGLLKLYVDGALVASQSVSSTATYGSPLSGRIGSSITNNKFFKGKIDDVKIFSGSLIDPEVILLQNYTNCTNVFSDTFISVQSVSTSVICTGSSFIVRAFSNNLFPDNFTQFAAEMSDGTGSFANSTTIGSSSFLPLNVTIPANTPGGNYKIRVRYGGVVSVNTFDIFVNNPSTYNITGTVALNDGQSTNISLNFTGTGPWNYILSNGLSGVATSNPWNITVTPDQSTVYAVSSASNVCGTTTLNGNGSAIVTVNFTKQFVTCLPFNSNVNDAMGNNTATINGALLTDDRYGQQNAAFSFNGSNNYIEYTTNLLRKREFTMSAWVFANALPSGTNYILSQGDMNANTFQGLAMTGSGWQYQSYTSNGIYYVNSSTNWAANQWVHLTAVRGYQTLKLYVNGSLVATTSNNSQIPFKVSDIGRVGANSSSLGSYFNGKIDDIRLYKGALNDDEVFALYASTNNCSTVENAQIIVVRGLTPTSVCAGNTVSVNYTVSNVNVSAGSPLSVQLSDQFGNFTNATIIGSGFISPISATIPANTVNSNFYRIRLISGAVTSVNANTLSISGNLPTATISGNSNIQNGQSANLTLTFTGSSPWTYALNNGSNQSTSTSPLILPVSPFSTTTYTITSVSNSCGAGTSTGTATVTVAPYIGIGALGNTSFCTGTNFSVPFQANFSPNNNFRVELSDATGNFTSPTQIGVGTISPITVQIPNSVTTATGYKIRMVSDSPAVISASTSALTINSKATATISGTATINEGQSTNLTVNFTGQSPWTYSITGGASQTTSTNPVTIPVLPTITTTYSVTSISNAACGTGTALGSAVITVNPVPLRLISCFPFNGNANDGKGINNGTVNGATLTTDRFGNANSAYSFNGSSSVIQFPLNQVLNNEYSYSLWFNGNSFDWQFLFSIEDANAYNANFLAFSDIDLRATSNTNWCSYSKSNLITGQWYLATVTRDMNLIKLYINGIFVASNSVSNSPAFGSTNYVGLLGRRANGYGSFSGKIDDVQIYKGALTAEQIQVLYNSNDGCFDASTISVLGIQSLSSSTFCKGQSLSIPFGSANITNPIKIQLSDVNGSFASPTEIGSGSASPITAQIPANQAVGTAYKIRLVSSDAVPIVSNAISNISVNAAVTASISGTATINEGQLTNLTINFTGTAPYTYNITGGTSQTTTSNPITISVSPIANTTYTITSLSNACGSVTGIGSATITVIPVPIRLVSCFPFNGNANDSKGLNNGAVSGATLTTDRFGNPNSAYSFNGSNGNIQIGANQLLNEEYTYSMWFNPSNTTNYMYLFSLESVNGIGLRMYGTDIRAFNSFEHISYPINNFIVGQWYHVTITRTFSFIKMYINGILVVTSNITYYNIFSLSNYNAYIGGKNSNEVFNGKIDDVQIYKGALTSGQVQALYQNQSACFDATTYTCLSNATYNSMLNGQQRLQVSNQIIGSSIIQTGSNIYFDSKNAVMLQPGFKTEGNAVFKATVGGGCN